ncbi:sigma-70 family RNA polymerase sigma factor [Microbacterium sp. XT11]|uniref:sigma-70 family RNA polymerase sigma factor n=1 Tax=Microbacterium sp. XT11 TaxID=367477 RepID=UPI000742EB99|nr:sigma-70 family RNA polymerase sigma factor [Microbacterium sp. XT11]ALX66047.1 sigma-70 family RNA polymerase sigma factor [Microbacterium sp. XT11]
MSTDDAAAARSDDELVELVRAGDSIAYGELWRRHAGPALSVARTFVSLDAEDIVSEAFARVLRAIRSGGGPTAGFRPYLVMAVRNVGRRWYSRDTDIAVDDFEFVVDPGAKEGELSAVEEFEGGAAMAAFRSLPTRWQEVLWYSEVDGLKPREISPILGLAPNAVSSLLLRAKRSLRDAWISAQLAASTKPECQAAVKEMGAYTRDALSERARAKLESHLEVCADCPKALAEARNIATIAAALLPAVAGTVGAAGYAATTPAPPVSMAMAAAEHAAFSSRSDTDAVEDDEHGRQGDRRGLTLLLLLAAAVAVVSVATVWSLVPEGGTPTSSQHGSDRPATAAPEPTPRPSSAAPRSQSPEQEPFAAPESDAPPPDAPDVERRGSSWPVVAQPDAAQGSVARPGAPRPSSPPASGTPSAPTAELAQLDERMYPWITGTDAIPGALVEVVSDDGSVWDSARARSDGSWTIQVERGEAGSHSVAVRQTVAEHVSPVSAPLVYSVTAGPRPRAPGDGAVVSSERFNFRLSGPPGTVIQREIVGVTGVQTLRLPSSGEWNEYLSLPPGEHVIRLRHAAPDTRDFGPWTRTTVIAQ